jgi:hypothetical protein
MNQAQRRRILQKAEKVVQDKKKGFNYGSNTEDINAALEKFPKLKTFLKKFDKLRDEGKTLGFDFSRRSGYSAASDYYQLHPALRREVEKKYQERYKKVQVYNDNLHEALETFTDRVILERNIEALELLKEFEETITSIKLDA